MYRVMIISNGEVNERQIGEELKDLQAVVGGYIEIASVSRKLSEKNILVICNEEGNYISSCLPEVALIKKGNCIADGYLVGNIILIGNDYENSNMKSLTDEQIKFIKQEFKRKAFVQCTKYDEEKKMEKQILKQVVCLEYDY